MGEMNLVLPMNESALVSMQDRAIGRAQIHSVEKKLLEMPPAEIPLRHTFSKGVYAREITIPAGTLLVGKIHKHLNMNIISKGDVSFFSVDGSLRVEAPYTFVAAPGVKRVIYAHSDSVWTTIHGTELTDLAEIENEFIAKDYDEIDVISDEELRLIAEAKKCLGL